MGGWGDPAFDSGRTAGTTDGGRTWTDLTAEWPRPFFAIPCEELNPRGQYINRFRIVGDTVYACDNTVYKFTTQAMFTPTGDEVAGTQLLAATQEIPFRDSAEFDVTVPENTQSLRVALFDCFSGPVRTLIEESNPAAGTRTVSWDRCDDSGERLPSWQYMVRVTCDEVSESRLLAYQPDRLTDPTANFQPHVLERV